MKTWTKQIRWEIALALTLKVALLVVLWKLSYSEPSSHVVNGPVTAKHILSPY